MKIIFQLKRLGKVEPQTDHLKRGRFILQVFSAGVLKMKSSLFKCVLNA